MTSPATNPGAVASGAVPLRDYSCTECGRTFSGDAPFIRWSGHRADPFVDSPCSGVVVLDVIRDDRAGVTLPTAIQPVGGDQLEAAPAGQVDGESDAGGGHKDNIATGGADGHVNRPMATGPAASVDFTERNHA